MQRIDATLSEPAAPAANRLRTAAQLRGDVLTRQAVRRRQHDPATQGKRLRALRAPSPTLKHLPLALPDNDPHTLGHNRLLSSSMTKEFAAPNNMPAN